MVAAPHIDVDFGLRGASGHYHFSVADHLGIGIPGGMDLGLGHERNQRLENWGALRAFLRPYLRRSLAGISAEMTFGFQGLTIIG